MSIVEHVDTRHLTRQPLNIRVLRVESPTLFWVKITNSEETDNFNKELLNWWMPRRLRYLQLWPQNRYYRAPVAIEIEGNWERGELLQEVDVDQYVVGLRDAGVEVYANQEELYRLPKLFHTRRWRAIPCSLVDIVPTKFVTMEWAPSEVMLMKNLCEGKEGHMKIRGSTESGLGAFVYLTLKQPAGYIDIESLLINNNCGHRWPRPGTAHRYICRGLELLPPWRSAFLDDAW